MDSVAETATAVFVGRETELHALDEAFAAAAAGEPQVVIVEGEAGIGKTTLVGRFVAGVAPVRLLRASGEDAQMHAPVALAGRLLRSAGGEGGGGAAARPHRAGPRPPPGVRARAQ